MANFSFFTSFFDFVGDEEFTLDPEETLSMFLLQCLLRVSLSDSNLRRASPLPSRDQNTHKTGKGTLKTRQVILCGIILRESTVQSLIIQWISTSTVVYHPVQMNQGVGNQNTIMITFGRHHNIFEREVLIAGFVPGSSLLTFRACWVNWQMGL